MVGDPVGIQWKVRPSLICHCGEDVQPFRDQDRRPPGSHRNPACVTSGASHCSSCRTALLRTNDARTFRMPLPLALRQPLWCRLQGFAASFRLSFLGTSMGAKIGITTSEFDMTLQGPALDIDHGTWPAKAFLSCTLVIWPAESDTCLGSTLIVLRECSNQREQSREDSRPGVKTEGTVPHDDNHTPVLTLAVCQPSIRLDAPWLPPLQPDSRWGTISLQPASVHL